MNTIKVSHHRNFRSVLENIPQPALHESIARNKLPVAAIGDGTSIYRGVLTSVACLKYFHKASH